MPKAAHAKEKNRRPELIDAAINSIAEYGLSDVTVAKVAKQAGMSPGIVNFYFRTKQRLLLDTLEHLEREFNTVLESHLVKCATPAEKLTAIICANFDAQVFNKQKIAVWYAFWGESQAREDYRAICGRSDEAIGQTIRDLYAELLPAESPDIESSARGLEGVIEGIWQRALYENSGLSADDAIATCKQYLNMTLRNANELIPMPPAHRADTADLLAPWTYQNGELLELEIKHLFRPSWMLAGHISDLPESGSYLTVDAIGERALVIRDEQGTLRAFHNVCRHRGARIVEGAGRCSKQGLMCQFHGWRYALDGRLQFIPGKSQGFSKVDEAAKGLVPLDLEVWHGFIFIRFESQGQSLAEQMQPVEALLANQRLDELIPYVESRNSTHHSRDTHPCNWKLFVDVDNEGYHVPIGHPSLQQLYGNGYSDTEIEGIPVSYGPFNEMDAKLWSVRNYLKLLPKFEHLSEQEQNRWLYVGLFPNTVFGLYPDSMETYQVFPTSVNECQVVSRTYALPDHRREVQAVRYLNRRINSETEFEDRSFMKWLQQGMSSSVYPEWTLSETAETGVAAYHKKVQAALPVSLLAHAPPSGTVAQVNESLSG